MRRLLTVLMATTTAVVVLGFVVPFTLAIRSVERSDEITGIVNSGTSLAAFIDDDTPIEEIADAIVRFEEEFTGIEVTVYGRDGSVTGLPVRPSPEVAVAFAGTEIVQEEDGGVVVYIPNNGPFDIDGESDFVIRLAASDDVIALRLVPFGSVLVLSTIIAVIVGGGIGLVAARSISTPTRQLTEVARRLQHGELDVRATPRGPRELRELAETLNHLATRVNELLVRERESVADLAHRLRTPLAALHLEIEALDDSPEAVELLARTRRLETTLNQLLAEMRRPEEHEKTMVDVCAIARDRLADWTDVAHDAGRTFRVDVRPAGPRTVIGDPADIEAAFDTIINNAFKHTPDGTQIEVHVFDEDERLRFSVEDAGPGLPSETVAERGVSSGQSSGLGLDIARRTAEELGGELSLGRSSIGGASVALVFPVERAEV